MAPLFPAVLIGGGSEPDITRLTDELSRRLQQAGLMHYVLRLRPAGATPPRPAPLLPVVERQVPAQPWPA